MTGRPVASCGPAALLEPMAAATQVYFDASVSSRATSAALGLLASSRPPSPPWPAWPPWAPPPARVAPVPPPKLGAVAPPAPVPGVPPKAPNPPVGGPPANPWEVPVPPPGTPPRANPRPKPPPGPPPAPATLGPAVGMLPECGVAAVSNAYATGPAKPTNSAATATTAAPRAYRRGGTSSAAAAATPTTTTATRIHGCHPGVRASSTADHAAVVRTAIASTTRTSSRRRARQNVTAPMPTIAAIAGARATV